jgi:hypothetical protein
MIVVRLTYARWCDFDTKSYGLSDKLQFVVHNDKLKLVGQHLQVSFCRDVPEAGPLVSA